jgi:hypothetical protein
LRNNFSVDLGVGTHYESNVLTLQQQLKQSIFSYVLCQLSSTPADQKHVTSIRHVKHHCLTHIGIISPVLQKIVCNITSIERIEDIIYQRYGKYCVLGIVALCICIGYCTEFTSSSQRYEKPLFGSSCFSIRRAFCPHGTTLLVAGWYLKINTLVFSKICWENSVLMNIWLY